MTSQNWCKTQLITFFSWLPAYPLKDASNLLTMLSHSALPSSLEATTCFLGEELGERTVSSPDQMASLCTPESQSRQAPPL